MKNRFPFLGIFSIMMVVSSFSLAQYNLHFKSYTTSNGLPSGSFIDIRKSPNGYLWLHSENGISKFNGYDFTTYYFNSKNEKSFSSTQMLTSFEDSLGNIFLTSKDALFLFDNETHEFNKLLGFENLNDLIFFESNKHSSYALVKNNLYTIQLNPIRISKTVIPELSVKKHTTPNLISNGILYLCTSDQFFLLDLSTKKFQQHYFNSPIKLPVYLNTVENGAVQISAVNQLFNYLPNGNKLRELSPRALENPPIRNHPGTKREVLGGSSTSFAWVGSKAMDGMGRCRLHIARSWPT